MYVVALNDIGWKPFSPDDERGFLIEKYGKDETSVTQFDEYGRPPDGRGACPVGGQWNEKGNDGETYHRDSQFVYSVCAGAYPPARGGSAGEGRD